MSKSIESFEESILSHLPDELKSAFRDHWNAHQRMIGELEAHRLQARRPIEITVDRGRTVTTPTQPFPSPLTQPNWVDGTIGISSNLAKNAASSNLAKGTMA